MPSDRDDTSPKPDTGAPGAAPTPTPFARAPQQWGRPPPVVFRTGPLPKATEWPATPPGAKPIPPRPAPAAAPARRAGSGIFNASMVPQALPPGAGPASRETLPPVPKPAVATPAPDASFVGQTQSQGQVPAATPLLVESAPESLPDVAPKPVPTPDITVRPLPAAPLPVAPKPAPQVEAVIPSAIAATSNRRRKSSKTPLYVGVGVLALLLAGGAALLISRPAPDAPMIATAPVQTAAPIEGTPSPIAAAPAAIEPALQPAPAPVAAPTAPAAARPAPVTAPARSPASTVRPTTTATAPASRAVTPTPAAAPPPVITVQPLVETPPAPPPTAARSTPVDPDAPIQTRPQSLD